MSEPRVRALVLAAGKGTRLRPLTETVPKPLLPVGGEPILALTLAQLEEVGCEATAINLHHQGKLIRERLGSRFGEMPLAYSTEETLLGTLGATGPLRYVFEPADVAVVINGDSLCRWPIKKVIRAHRKRQSAVATLLVSDKADPEAFGGGIGLDENDCIVSFRPGEDFGKVVRRCVFAGLHAFSPRLLERAPEGPADFVRDLYQSLLEEGSEIQAVTTSRDWHDLGTPKRYLDGVLDWTRGRRARRLLPTRSLISEDAVVDETARIRASCVENDVDIGPNAVVENSVLLPGSKVGSESEVRDAILGFDVDLAPGTSVQGRLVNPKIAGFTAGPNDSLLGDLVYTPLDS